MKFKKILITLFLTTTILATPVYAEVNSETLNLISSEKENIINNGYEISNNFKIFINDE